MIQDNSSENSEQQRYVSYGSDDSTAKAQEITYLPAIDLNSLKTDDDDNTGFIYQKRSSGSKLKKGILAVVVLMMAVILFIVGYCGLILILDSYKMRQNGHIVVPNNDNRKTGSNSSPRSSNVITKVPTQRDQKQASVAHESPFCVCSITRTYRKSGLVQRATMHVPLHGDELNHPAASCRTICQAKRPEIMHQLDEQAKEAKVAIQKEIASDLSHQMHHLVQIPGLPIPLFSFPPTRLDFVKEALPSSIAQMGRKPVIDHDLLMNHTPSPLSLVPKRTRKIVIIRPIPKNVDPRKSRTIQRHPIIHAPVVNNRGASQPMNQMFMNEMLQDGMKMLNQAIINDLRHDMDMISGNSHPIPTTVSPLNNPTKPNIHPNIPQNQGMQKTNAN
jgi:hypothetical protein